MLFKVSHDANSCLVESVLCLRSATCMLLIDGVLSFFKVFHVANLINLTNMDSLTSLPSHPHLISVLPKYTFFFWFILKFTYPLLKGHIKNPMNILQRCLLNGWYSWIKDNIF